MTKFQLVARLQGICGNTRPLAHRFSRKTTGLEGVEMRWLRAQRAHAAFGPEKHLGTVWGGLSSEARWQSAILL